MNRTKTGLNINWDLELNFMIDANKVRNKPITNTAWLRAQLCKLQKRVHSTRSCK
jgi:hypothetical protein